MCPVARRRRPGDPEWLLLDKYQRLIGFHTQILVSSDRVLRQGHVRLTQQLTVLYPSSREPTVSFHACAWILDP